MKIENWMTSNKLTLNHNKTKFMVVSKKGVNGAMNIRINNYQIEQVDSIEFLGVIIDSKLSWNQHIKQLESSLSTTFEIMSKIRHFVILTV